MADEIADQEVGASRWQRMRPVARPVLLVALSLVVGWIIVNLVGAIDWGAVASSFGKIAPWMVVPLIVDLLARQLFNAVPLSRYVPGLSLRRSMQNDLAANLVGTVAPPPGDMVLRVAMFRSWGIDPVIGMAGVMLNMLTFYSVRFLAPVIGLLLIAFQGAERRQVVVALVCGLVALVLLGALGMLLRGDGLAALLGRTAGRVARRFRRSIDPEAWAAAVVDIRARSADQLRAGLLRSLLALVVMVVADGVIVFMALRFVGIGSDRLSVIDVLGAFLLAYPLTIMPLAGFGVLDAVLLATWTEIAGAAYEPEIVAALVVWRVVTILGPLLLGLGTFLLWRWAYRSIEPTTAEGTAAREVAAAEGTTDAGSPGS